MNKPLKQEELRTKIMDTLLAYHILDINILKQRNPDLKPMTLRDAINSIETLIAQRDKQVANEARLSEADWFIKVREKALMDGSYPDHAVITKHYKELEKERTQDERTTN